MFCYFKYNKQYKKAQLYSPWIDAGTSLTHTAVNFKIANRFTNTLLFYFNQKRVEKIASTRHTECFRTSSYLECFQSFELRYYYVKSRNVIILNHPVWQFVPFGSGTKSVNFNLSLTLLKPFWQKNYSSFEILVTSETFCNKLTFKKLVRLGNELRFFDERVEERNKENYSLSWCRTF